MAKINRHRQERAIDRSEIKQIYKNVETKRDAHDRFDIDRVKQLESFFYAGLDPRRRNEIADGGMVQEDPRAVANLSGDFVHGEYPRFGFYSTPYIDDTVNE